jgi:hypothetical protein
MTHHLLPIAAAVPLLLGGLSAQSPDHLIGLTRTQSTLRSVDHANCAPLGHCALPLPGTAVVPPFAGGTGWDPKRPGAWVSDGRLLAKFADDCTLLCAPIVPPTLGPNAFITGIEVAESQDQVVFVDSLGFLHFYTNTCPPLPLQSCQTGLLPTALGNVTTGLAIDDDEGLVFVSYPIYPVGPNRIAVLRLANPCQVVCQFNVQPCPTAVFGALTGLACDWGRQVLYGTDGHSTIAMHIATTTTSGCVQILSQDCCTLPAAAEPFVGLAIRPGGGTPHGQPCNNGTCPNCQNMLTLRNDPCLGNAQFGLGLDHAPANALSWCLFGTGPCHNAGVVVPLLCGPVWVGPMVGSLGPNPTGGGAFGCTGSTTFPFPLPADAAFAGWVLSAQCATLCFHGAGIGTALSNCLSFQLQGN